MSFAHAGQAALFLEPNSVYNVFVASSGAAATLYTDASKGTTASPSVATDPDGNATFYADPGSYILKAVGPTEAPYPVPCVVGVNPLDLGAGGGGDTVTYKIPFDHSTPNLDRGVAVYTPAVGDVILFASTGVSTAWNAAGFGDFGQFVGTNTGIGHRYIDACDMTIVDEAADNTGVGLVGQYQRNGLDNTQPIRFTTTDPLKVVVSQDGTNVYPPTYSSVIAAAPATAPTTVIAATNDTFGYGPFGSETNYTVAPGVYTTADDLAAAMSAAVDGSSNPLSDVVGITNIAGTFTATTVSAGYDSSGPDLITGATDFLAASGFSNGQQVGGGQGGATGATAGAGFLYLVVCKAPLTS